MNNRFTQIFTEIQYSSAYFSKTFPLAKTSNTVANKYLAKH